MDAHGFASYNKTGETKTLIANWQEERALKDQTGQNRYERWVEQGETESVYATRQDRIGFLPTNDRTLQHREQLAAGELVSQNQVTYQHPQQRVNLLAEYKGVPGAGPRERMEMEMLLAEARNLPQAGKDPNSFDTTYRDNFTPHDLTGTNVGARVMKDPDGRPAYHDPVFVAETKIMTKDAADRLIPPRPETTMKVEQYKTTLVTNGLDLEETPVTLYTEAQAGHTYAGEIPGTKPEQGFGKYTNFSKPMSDYSKVVENE